MPDINVLAVVVATIVAFAMSATYYVVVGDQLAEVSPAAAAEAQPPPWKIAAELVRSSITVTVIAGLASRTDTDEWTGGLLLGLALWIGFPLMLWAGAMLHENTPWKLAAIHAGDWLIKLAVVTVIVTIWH